MQSYKALHKNKFYLTVQNRHEYPLPVVVKVPSTKPSSLSQIKQLNNEFSITSQLAGVTGVRSVLAREGTASQPILFLAYIQGHSLAELIQMASFNLLDKLRIAVDLVGILGRIQAHQVIHNNISSSNILIADDASVSVIDFKVATIMQKEVPPLLALNDADVKELAYISPEQSGRMNRPVDYRTDFYSLGVTLYELFTGHLPFRTKDPLEMVHAHFAHTPSPPTEINPDIPLPISQIIQKLLAKNAEDRYQSWESLKNDLRRCLVEYQTKGEIQPFTLATEDFTGKLQFPDKLYGRNRDISQLTDAFARIKQGKNEVLLVAGFSGVGKTSLVRALRPAVFAQQGIFIEGKFDQYQRSIPY